MVHIKKKKFFFFKERNGAPHSHSFPSLTRFGTVSQTQNLQYPLFLLTLCIPVVTQILACPLNPPLLSTSTTFAWVQILITDSLGSCGHFLSGLPSLTQMLVPAFLNTDATAVSLGNRIGRVANHVLLAHRSILALLQAVSQPSCYLTFDQV